MLLGAPYLSEDQQRHAMARSYANEHTSVLCIAGVRAGAQWFMIKCGAMRPDELRQKRVCEHC